MQNGIRLEFTPDIEVKFMHLCKHMNEKNGVVEQFIKILKEMCDSQLFYSRNLDKYANNVSKLLVGKDPLKEVFIVFERMIAAKAEQSLILANNIKDDMIPFLLKEVVDVNEQKQFRSRDKFVKDMRTKMQKKLKSLRNSELSYKKSYESLKKYGNTKIFDYIQKENAKKNFTDKETHLVQTINLYNHTVEQYMLDYSSICDRLSDLQTKRKRIVRDSVNKYMIFEMNSIKNIEYNIPRYMKSLQTMEEKLIIQEKAGALQQEENVVHLAKIAVNNYICNLNDRDKVEIPTLHKKILDLKKNTQQQISSEKYHLIMEEANKILDQIMLVNDVRGLKELIYFARNISCTVTNKKIGSSEVLQQQKKEQINSSTSIQSRGDELRKKKNQIKMFLLDAIMCHQVFISNQFWKKYQKRLLEIVQRQNHEAQNAAEVSPVNLNFLSGDIQFLKIISYHKLPSQVLNIFIIPENNDKKDQKVKEKEHILEKERYLRMIKYI